MSTRGAKKSCIAFPAGARFESFCAESRRGRARAASIEEPGEDRRGTPSPTWPAKSPGMPERGGDLGLFGRELLSPWTPWSFVLAAVVPGHVPVSSSPLSRNREAARYRPFAEVGRLEEALSDNLSTRVTDNTSRGSAARLLKIYDPSSRSGEKKAFRWSREVPGRERSPRVRTRIPFQELLVRRRARPMLVLVRR